MNLSNEFVIYSQNDPSFAAKRYFDYFINVCQLIFDYPAEILHTSNRVVLHILAHLESKEEAKFAVRWKVPKLQEKFAWIAMSTCTHQNVG